MHYAIVMRIDAPNDDAQDTDSTNRPIDFAAQHMSVTSSDSRSVVNRLTCNAIPVLQTTFLYLSCSLPHHLQTADRAIYLVCRRVHVLAIPYTSIAVCLSYSLAPAGARRVVP